jgi:hypothetical protein
MFETLGLVPSAGRRLARAEIPAEEVTLPPARGRSVMDQIVGMLGDVFARVPEEVGQAAKMRALTESIEQTIVSFQQLNTYLEQTRNIMTQIMPQLGILGEDRVRLAMDQLGDILRQIGFSGKKRK